MFVFLSALCLLIPAIATGQEEVEVTYSSLGVNDKTKIPDYRITASSDYGGGCLPIYGRLDATPATSSYVASWCAGKNEKGEWIQVDLGRPAQVAGVVTQGRGTYAQWVTSYTIGCMMDDDLTVLADSDNGQAKVFTGNNDQNTKVTNLFKAPMTCRYVRIYPQSYSGHMSMRFDVIGKECCA